MIQIDKVIKYLRTSFKGKYIVGGAASYFIAKDNSRLMSGTPGVVAPTLFVMLGVHSATPLSQAPILQDTDSRLIVVACLDNSLDREGNSAQQEIFHVRKDLYSFLLNFRLDMDSFPIQAVRDQIEDMDRARYWHQFEFRMTGRLDESDGVQTIYPDLNSVIATYNSTFPNADNPIAVDPIEPLF